MLVGVIEADRGLDIRLSVFVKPDVERVFLEVVNRECSRAGKRLRDQLHCDADAVAHINAEHARVGIHRRECLVGVDIEARVGSGKCGKLHRFRRAGGYEAVGAVERKGRIVLEQNSRVV